MCCATRTRTSRVASVSRRSAPSGRGTSRAARCCRVARDGSVRAMGLGQRLRYRFDNLMARGVGAQILLLAACTVLLVGITMLLLVVLDVVPANDQGQKDSTAMLAWKSLMHTLDAGTVGGDSGSWTFLFVFLFATIGGIFVV